MVDIPLDDFAMDPAALAGPLEQRLQAVREAGIPQLVLDARDLAQHPGGFEAAARTVRASGLRVAALRLLPGFEGLAGAAHAHKVQVAQSMLAMCRAVGSPLLVAAAATAEGASGDRTAIARDLRKLALLALPLGIRVAYQALCWGRHVRDLSAASDVVVRADCPNLGLAIDAFHDLMAGTPPQVLDEIDPQQVFLVQLADAALGSPLPAAPAECAALAATAQLFPGEGDHAAALAALVVGLDRLGCRAVHALVARHDDFQALPAADVAQRARRAAQWLAEDVLRRSAPLPNRMRLRGAAPG